MAEAKKTTKKTAAPKKGATKKASPKAAEAVTEEAVESIFARIQAGFKEAGAALGDSNAIMGDKRREVLLTMLENAQENADATFDALREAMDAESFTDSLRIQRDALREGIERNVAQVRNVSSLTAEGSRETIAPVTEYLSSLREKVRGSANA